MAKRKQQDDMISRLAHTGEEALHRLAELPGGTKFLEAANALRDRVDELAVRIRTLDPLEKRVTEIERRLDELSATKRSPSARKPATRRASGTRRSVTARASKESR